jgi:hypothetical protein
MDVQVQNMTNNNGNYVPNQFEIFTKQAVYFQSYSTVIVKKRLKDGQVYLDRNKWDYSTTTGKYRNQFLREGIAETRKKIGSGEYKLVDLNKG